MMISHCEEIALHPRQDLYQELFVINEIETKASIDTSGLSFSNEKKFMEKPIEKKVPEYMKMIKENRKREEKHYLEIAKGNEKEALNLWIKDMKRQAEKEKIPQWLKNARSTV